MESCAIIYPALPVGEFLVGRAAVEIVRRLLRAVYVERIDANSVRVRVSDAGLNREKKVAAFLELKIVCDKKTKLKL